MNKNTIIFWTSGFGSMLAFVFISLMVMSIEEDWKLLVNFNNYFEAIPELIMLIILFIFFISVLIYVCKEIKYDNK